MNVDVGGNCSPQQIPVIELSDTEMPTENSQAVISNTTGDKDFNKNASEKAVNNKYREIDAGPYYIFVEHKYLNIGNLHPMRLGHLLEKLSNYDPYIKEYSAVGRNRVKIEVTSPAIANDLIKHEIFPQNNLVAYIPQHCIEKKGIIRFVDTFFSEDEILSRVKSNIPVKQLKRITRLGNKDNKSSERIPTQTVIITFVGSELPQYVYINKVRYPVENYIAPVVQCFKCLLFGHTSKQCRSNKNKCHKCGQEHEGNCGESVDPFCIHCQTNAHNSLSKNCPMYEKQFSIKKTMAKLNISFKEAEKVQDNPSFANILKNNRFAPLLDDTDNFPHLSAPNLKQYQPSVSKKINNIPNNPPKKRKAPESPHFEPVQREFPRSFCGPPISSNPHTTMADKSIEDIKNEIIKGILNLLQGILSQPGIEGLDFEGLTVNIADSINKLFANIPKI